MIRAAIRPARRSARADCHRSSVAARRTNDSTLARVSVVSWLKSSLSAHFIILVRLTAAALNEQVRLESDDDLRKVDRGNVLRLVTPTSDLRQSRRFHDHAEGKPASISERSGRGRRAYQFSAQHSA
jgi:hypothetical protein